MAVAVNPDTATVAVDEEGLAPALKRNTCPATYAVIAGDGESVSALAVPPAVPQSIYVAFCTLLTSAYSVRATPAATPVCLKFDIGRLAVIVVWPSTAMLCVNAVAIAALLSSTCVELITVPDTKSG